MSRRYKKAAVRGGGGFKSDKQRKAVMALLQKRYGISKQELRGLKGFRYKPHLTNPGGGPDTADAAGMYNFSVGEIRRNYPGMSNPDTRRIRQQLTPFISVVRQPKDAPKEWRNAKGVFRSHDTAAQPSSLLNVMGRRRKDVGLHEIGHHVYFSLKPKDRDRVDQLLTGRTHTPSYLKDRKNWPPARSAILELFADSYAGLRGKEGRKHRQGGAIAHAHTEHTQYV